ncbi:MULTISPECIES: ATP-binding cassette domain-containing protein [Lacticaseibacillus]|uniref:ABC transporter ATP-binding protein n=2 Tax=Lacticaseibacillus TaxID=2759736 RepID=A0AAN1C673_LACCA|nr:MULTISPECIES: ABC transporter ATP-binding protein [Lacticaseibacillus]ARY90339.1 ABC transporter ATP-binding protein [Lacticaseibacillus casei]KAB1969916.1 ABC transporter ATP-binding protein [Lacticaseibacillus casei]WLV80957.1 ABC transporter ATP-binding protein [Lacticaseibacillus sp. NCIMB 15473]WNX24916.1 ABC transporter ATP-binding protein [Lacticaseibacillus casei]WNX27687.1 ABC transporter ATP-binding protein [Lacticaseibacillus casei]
MSILTLQHVSKHFGDKQVLQDLNLTVPTGSIYGFVGENGAGKTTTMKLILGLDRADGGDIDVAGERVHFGQTSTNRQTGYLPDVPAFYGYMTATEYLRMCGQLTGLRGIALDSRVTAMLKRVGLAKASHRIGGFSRGMRQRLGIAQALLTMPKLLICDEPTSALDPQGRTDFLELLASLRGQTTILFSTHILSDVERICDHVGILHHGRLQVTASLADLKQQYAKPRVQLTFETSAQAQEAAAILAPQQHRDHVQQVTQSASEVTVAYTGAYAAAADQILTKLLAARLIPLTFSQQEANLEQIFMEVVQ